MKKLLFILALTLPLSALFYACEKEQNLADEDLIAALSTNTLQNITPAQLPAKVRQTVDELFFHTYMEDIQYGRGLGYRIVMGDETCLFFRENGEMLEFRHDPGPRGGRPGFGPNGPHGPCFDRLRGFGRPVRPDSLPQAILDYISANYPDATIRMGRTNTERYFVLITGPRVLEFDANGNFVQEVSPLENCNPLRCRAIPGNVLPEAVRLYIREHYASATFRGACVRNDRIAVFLVNDGARLILVFDRATGEFLFSRP